MGTAGNAPHREPWNKGKIVGHKAPFKTKGIWALRVRLQMITASIRVALQAWMKQAGLSWDAGQSLCLRPMAFGAVQRSVTVFIFLR